LAENLGECAAPVVMHFERTQQRPGGQIEVTGSAFFDVHVAVILFEPRTGGPGRPFAPARKQCM